LTEQRARLTLEAEPAAEPEIGRWLAALANTRKRTLAALRDVPDRALDVAVESGENTIGMLLYHLAAIEADWLYDEILGTIDTDDFPKQLFPVDVRDHEGNLSNISEKLDEHLTRLEKVRDLLVNVVSAMTFEDMHAVREREQYDVTPAWVLHHLMQHEAEHRADILAIRQRLR
jgi:uncharacterized damage-inducible protein DinB